MDQAAIFDQEEEESIKDGSLVLVLVLLDGELDISNFQWVDRGSSRWINDGFQMGLENGISVQRPFLVLVYAMIFESLFNPTGPFRRVLRLGLLMFESAGCRNVGCGGTLTGISSSVSDGEEHSLEVYASTGQEGGVARGRRAAGDEDSPRCRSSSEVMQVGPVGGGGAA